MLTHLLTTETVSKLLVCDRKIQIDVQIDTCYGKPEPIIMMINHHNSILHDFLCPQLTRNVRGRRRIDSSSIIAHPVNFERSLKCDAKNSTYIWYNIYIPPLDNRYGFCISVQPDCATFHIFFVWKKRCFLKFSKVDRSAIGWRSG